MKSRTPRILCGRVSLGYFARFFSINPDLNLPIKFETTKGHVTCINGVSPSHARPSMFFSKKPYESIVELAFARRISSEAALGGSVCSDSIFLGKLQSVLGVNWLKTNFGVHQMPISAETEDCLKSNLDKGIYMALIFRPKRHST